MDPPIKQRKKTNKFLLTRVWLSSFSEIHFEKIATHHAGLVKLPGLISPIVMPLMNPPSTGSATLLVQWRQEER